MSPAKPVRVLSVFGDSLSNSYILAAHPDESFEPTGLPRVNCRTFLLKIQGDEAVYEQEIGVPLIRSWHSRSGVVYCLAVQRPILYTWRGGTSWSEENFSTAPVSSVRSVFAVPGVTPESDTVFVATSGKMFIRIANRWISKRALGEGLPFHMTGSQADQVFIGGSDLCLWNGKKLVALEEPKDDTLLSLILSADDRLVGGTTYVSISTPGGEWERIKTPMQRFIAYGRLHNDVYALSFRQGLVRVYPGPVQVVSPPIDPWGLVSTEDGLIAYGKDVVLLYDGSHCRSVKLPTCELGGTPK